MKSMKWIYSILFVLPLAMGSPKLFAAAVALTGAGASFPYPLYTKWFSEYEKHHPGVKIDYQSIGSGGGIRQLMEKTVDFGATDTPMDDSLLKQSTAPIVHIPTVIGAVALTYNVTGLTSGLKLSAEVISEIFLGQITQWNDPKVQHLNPELKLPEINIMVVHRSDGSGTTGIFTDYLSKVSPSWKEKVGHGTAVSWPIGLGEKGNEGVSGRVKKSNASIGYVELVYAKINSLAVAAVQNKSGKFIIPSMDSVSAAAAGVMKTMPDDFRMSITNPEGSKAYPISGFTYLLLYQSMPKTKVDLVKRFLLWAMGDGQKLALAQNYAPLPEVLISKVKTKVGRLKALNE